MRSNFVYSQATYQKSFGLRIGFSTGLSYKSFLNNETSYEVALISRISTKNTYLLGMYFWNTNIGNGWTFYSGLGLHAGSKDVGYGQTTFAMGADGALGVEYKFFRTPFMYAIEYKPQLDLLPSPTQLWFDEICLCLRYTIR
jgi:hypothetical protein